MTTPAGVPNLPKAALTLETLESKIQDMSGNAMKERAVERFPAIMDKSTGLSPALDISPFGILTRIYAEATSIIANADPADINGPEDIPDLLLEFIEGLPVVGQFVGVLEAILGTYDGEDQTLLLIQEFFAPVRNLINTFISVFTGSPTGAGGLDSLIKVLTAPLGLLSGALSALDQLQQSVAAALTGNSNRITALENLLSPGAVGGGFDDLNRTPGPAGVKWVDVDGALIIKPGGFIRTDHFAAGLHVDSTETDRHGVSVRLTSKFAGRCRAVMASNDAMTNYAAVEVSVGYFGDDSIKIVTGAGPRLVVVQRQYDVSNLPNDWVFGLEYDPETNAFTAFKNGQALGEPWVDAANLVTHGSSKRRTGVVSNCDDAGYAFWLGGIPAGFGITDFTFYDRPTA